MRVLLEKELKANWRSFRYPAFLLIILIIAWFIIPALPSGKAGVERKEDVEKDLKNLRLIKGI